MKIFSYAVSLFLASAAAANGVHDIMAQPHIVKFVDAYNEDPAAVDFKCSKEMEAVFTGLGVPCIDCFKDLIVHVDNSATCETLGAPDSAFCKDVHGCIKTCGTHDYTESAEALGKCVEENYPDHKEQEIPCPDLCKENTLGDTLLKVPALRAPTTCPKGQSQIGNFGCRSPPDGPPPMCPNGEEANRACYRKKSSWWQCEQDCSVGPPSRRVPPGETQGFDLAGEPSVRATTCPDGQTQIGNFGCRSPPDGPPPMCPNGEEANRACYRKKSSWWQCEQDCYMGPPSRRVPPGETQGFDLLSS